MAKQDAAGVKKARADILKVRANEIKLVKEYKAIVERLAYLDKLEHGLETRVDKINKVEVKLNDVHDKLHDEMHKLQLEDHKLHMAEHKLLREAHKVIVAQHEIHIANQKLNEEMHDLKLEKKKIDDSQKYLNKVKEEIHHKAIDNMHRYQADVEFIKKYE